MQPKAYPYKVLSPWIFLSAIALAFLPTIPFACEALTNRHAWKVNNIDLTSHEATNYFWFWCGLSFVAFVPVTAYFGIKAIMSRPKEFAFHSDRLIANLSVASTKKAEIPYAAIQQISVTARRTKHGQVIRTLNIQHAGGVTKVQDSYFQQKSDFDEVASSLQAMLQ